jgi:ABC-type Fe3+ transport system permease subunit
VTPVGGGAAWGSVVAGLASCATLPAAIYATRYSDSYDLLHAAFAIPVAVASGVLGLALARRARARGRVTLSASGEARTVTAGHVLSLIGLCMAASALVALAVYGLLEYVGSRE